MANRFRQLLSPPRFEDDEQSRVGGLLHYILLTTLALNLLSIALLVTRNTPSPNSYWINFGLLFTQVGLLVLTRRGQVRLASILLAVALWLGVTLSVYSMGGLLNPNYPAYALVILIAGITLGGYAALGFAGLSIGAGIFLYINLLNSATASKQVPVGPAPDHVLLSSSIIFIVLALLLWVATRNVTRAMERSRQSENALSDKNEALQKEITERQKAETDLRTSEETARAFQERLKILNAVTIELSSADTFDDLCRQAVELGRALLGYDRLGLWFLDKDRQNIVGSFGTGEDGETRDERAITRPLGDGDYLFRRARDEKTPLIYEENNALFDHQGKAIGNGWLLEVLLWDGGELIGYISADNLFTQQPLTDSDKETLRLYGSTLGHLCTRKRTEEALQTSEETARDFQGRLKKLHEVSVELTKAASVDELCRKAVELGLARLGYDRIGIWFLDPDQETMIGAYGTDESGNVRDEHHSRIRIADDPLVTQALQKQIDVIGGEESTLTDDLGKEVGRGWNVMATVRDGERVIGWISADNLLKKCPLKPSDVEILKLYGTMLGHLYTRKVQEEDTHQFQDRLKALHEVNMELARKASFDDLCHAAVELGRNRLGFDRVGIWFIDQNRPEHIHGSFGTDENGKTRDERAIGLPLLGADQRFREAIHDRSRRIVLDDNEIIYNDRAEIVGHGQRAAGFMWNGDNLIGYVSIDNWMRHHPITHNDLEILTLYSAMIGHLSTGKRAEEALRANERNARNFQERLRVLHQVGIELTQARSFDDLCYKAIDLGRLRLGFDRLGIWFLDDDDPDYMLGSFGIDEHGHIRDERMMRLRIDSQDSRVIQAIEDRVGRLFADDNPIMIYNDKSQVVGQGAKAMALLWEGDDIVGTISTDNLIGGQPITDDDMEILTLYGAMLGHLGAKQKAEEALREERNLLRTIIDISQDYVYVKDTESRLRLVNRKFWESIPGVTSEQEVLGKTDLEVNIDPDEAPALVDEERILFQTGKPILNVEEDLADRQGRRHFLIKTKMPLRDAQGNIIGLVGLSRDITTLKLAEQERLDFALQTERVNLLTEFIGNMSHDLKTPLSVIKTSLYLLERLDDPLRQKAKIETMKDQILLLEKLIQDVLTMSRLEHSPDLVASTVDLNQLLLDVEKRLRPSAERKNLQAILNLAPDLLMARGNEDEIWRMMTNLVENALNYTLENGTVTIHTYNQDGKLVTEIQDTGIGISPEDVEHIFDRFYRADRARSFETGGTGLGLAIVKRIVEMHDGTIEVNSSLGQGSTFRVTLNAASK